MLALNIWFFCWAGIERQLILQICTAAFNILLTVEYLLCILALARLARVQSIHLSSNNLLDKCILNEMSLSNPILYLSTAWFTTLTHQFQVLPLPLLLFF